jgi:Holliday junction resolvase RusA-like endonuclease
MKKIYLASRFTRGPELREYKKTLERLGFMVTSRWLLGNHQISDAGLSEEAPPEERMRFAQEDWDDLCAADTCISFTEEPRSGHSRGGRHVEYGAALAMNKRCIVVGPRENVFHCLKQVIHFETWSSFLAVIDEIVSSRPRFKARRGEQVGEATKNAPEAAGGSSAPPAKSHGVKRRVRASVASSPQAAAATKISFSESDGAAWVQLPYPPQNNNFKVPIIVRGSVRMILSAKAAAYKKSVDHLKIGAKPLQGDVHVTIYAYRPRKVGDIDGVLKLVLDALTSAAYEDDKQIVKLTVWRRDDKDNPRIVAMVDRVQRELEQKGGLGDKQTEGAE